MLAQQEEYALAKDLQVRGSWIQFGVHTGSAALVAVTFANRPPEPTAQLYNRPLGPCYQILR